MNGYKLLPDEKKFLKGETRYDVKRAKQRITVQLEANMNGTASFHHKAISETKVF